MKLERLRIEGMSCQHCVSSLKKELIKLDLQIKDVQIGKAEIEYDDSKISHSEIEKAVRDAGFTLVKEN